MRLFFPKRDTDLLFVCVFFSLVTQNPRWEVIEAQTESPPARSGHSAAVYDGKIYIFGGADADYFYNDIWCFDTRALTWTPIPASGYLPTGRHGHSCTIVDGVLYVFGGSSPDGSDLNDAYAFRIHGMCETWSRRGFSFPPECIWIGHPVSCSHTFYPFASL